MGLASRKRRAGFSSRQGVYESPRPPSPVYGTKSPKALDTVTRCAATLVHFGAVLLSKLKWAGKPLLGLSRLDYPSAKTDKTVNGGAESAVHLDR